MTNKMKTLTLKRKLSHLRKLESKEAAKKAVVVAKRIGRELISRAKDGCFEDFVLYPSKVYPEDLTEKELKESLAYTRYLMEDVNLDLVANWLENQGLRVSRCNSYIPEGIKIHLDF